MTSLSPECPLRKKWKNAALISAILTTLQASIVLVRPDETNIKGINDLVGKRIGAQIGTTGATKAGASSVKGADVKQYNNANEPFIELDNKGVDAVINDQPVVAYYLVNGGKGKMVGDIMEAEYYGIAAKKGNKGQYSRAARRFLCCMYKAYY